MADSESDRRSSPRLPVTNSEIIGNEFSLFESPEGNRGAIRGLIEDVSEGGVCIRTSEPLNVSFPIRCHLPFAGSQVPVPTLMKVQWSQQISADTPRYRSGLRFLV